MTSFQNAGRSTLQNTQVKRAITKGLYGIDISELQKKQQIKRMYQQELRKQAEQVKRRKAQEKQKQRLYDEMLQKKMEIERKKQQSQKLAQKNKKLNQNNQVNQTNLNTQNNLNDNNNNSKSRTTQKYSLQNSRLNNISNSQSKQQFSYKNSLPNLLPYKLSVQNSNTYNPNFLQSQLPNIYSQYEDPSIVLQQQQFRIRRFKQSLDQKVSQIYRQIQSSKNSLGNNNSIIDDIRRRLKSNSYNMMGNQIYGINNNGNNLMMDMQKSGVKQFEEEYSQFYKVPKKYGGGIAGGSNSSNSNYNYGNTYNNNNNTGSRLKNLDYDSQSRYKSTLRNIRNTYNNNNNNNYQAINGFKQKNKTERLDLTDYQNNQPSKWGNQKDKNFLSNRQALDLQVNSIMSNIDNLIENQKNNQNGNQEQY